MKKNILLLIGFLFLNQLFAQQETDELWDLSLEELMDIPVVSASKKSQKMSEAPAIIDIISENDLKNGGFRSVGEALQTVPGFFVLTDHVTHNAGVRGINGGRQASSRIIKVLIDGHPISFQSTSENFLGEELIPITLVKRIEIIRGPASTLYGADAFLGVINIITKKGRELNKTIFKYGNTSAASNGSSYEATLGYGNEKLSAIVGVQTARYDRSGLELPYTSRSLKLLLDKEHHNTSPFGVETKDDLSKPFSVYGNIDYNPTVGNFSTHFYHGKLDNNGKFYDINPITNNNRIAIQNQYVKQAYKNTFLDSTLSINISAAYNEGKLLNDDLLDYSNSDTSGVLIKREMGYKSLSFQGEISYSMKNKFDFLVGIDRTSTEHDLLKYKKINKHNNTELPEVETQGETDFSNLGIYTQAVWYFSSKGTITAGLRYDNHSIYNEELSYRIGAVYSINKSIYTKLLYGTSFRAPTPAQLFSPQPPYNYRDGIVGNKDLTPETANTYEASIGVLPIKGLSLQINGFYNEIDGIIIVEETAGISSPINKNDIQSYGCELMAVYKKGGFSAQVSLSYQNSETENENNEDVNTSLFPEFMANGRISYATKYLKGMLQAYYIGEYTASQNNIENNLVFGKAEKYKLGDYTLLDLTLTSQNIFLPLEKINFKKEIELSLSVKNLLNKEYSYAGFYKYDIPALKRSIWFSIGLYI